MYKVNIYLKTFS